MSVSESNKNLGGFPNLVLSNPYQKLNNSAGPCGVICMIEARQTRSEAALDRKKQPLGSGFPCLTVRRMEARLFRNRKIDKNVDASGQCPAPIRQTSSTGLSLHRERLGDIFPSSFRIATPREDKIRREYDGEEDANRLHHAAWLRGKASCIPYLCLGSVSDCSMLQLRTDSLRPRLSKTAQYS